MDIRKDDQNKQSTDSTKDRKKIRMWIDARKLIHFAETGKQGQIINVFKGIEQQNETKKDICLKTETLDLPSVQNQFHRMEMNVSENIIG